MTEEQERYLVYFIGKEMYASPLLSIREVLEYQKPKFMPNMKPYVPGVVNIRGAIVGVVDLRSKFNIPAEVSRKTCMLLCDTGTGPIAAIVDMVDRVCAFEEEDIERKPVVQSRIERSYLVGVAKLRENLVVIMDLNKSLSEESLNVA